MTHTEDDRAIREQYHGDSKEPENGCRKVEVVEEWREQRVSLSELPSLYLRLSKHRLTGTHWNTQNKASHSYTMCPYNTILHFKYFI